MSVITSLTLDSAISSQRTEEGPAVKQEDATQMRFSLAKPALLGQTWGVQTPFSLGEGGDFDEKEPAEERQLKNPPSLLHLTSQN